MSDEAGFRGIDIARAAGDEHLAGDERQFVVFFEEDHDAVLELDALGLLRVELVEFGNGNLLPRFGLLGREG